MSGAMSPGFLAAKVEATAEDLIEVRELARKLAYSMKHGTEKEKVEALEAYHKWEDEKG